MVFPQLNQTLHIAEHLKITGFAGPINLVDFIPFIVAVVVDVFRAQILVTGIE